MNKNSIRIIKIILLIMLIGVVSIMNLCTNEDIKTNASISTKKIEWGIKRNDKHEQPDLGNENRKM